jgi:hypothetical protein
MMIAGLATALLPVVIYGQTVSSRSRPLRATFTPLVPKPKQPAKLSVNSLQFVDSDGNNLINANEACSISFTLTNEGDGSAYQIKPVIKETNRVQHLMVTGGNAIKELKPGHSETVRFLVKAGIDVPSALALFSISVNEGNGFDAPPQEIKVNTKAFDPPKLVVADAKFSTEDGGSTVNRNEVVTLQVVVQNQGQSNASGAKLSFILPFSNNIFAVEKEDFAIGTLVPGEQRVYEFSFIVNNRYDSDRVTIATNLTESYGKYGERSEQNLPLNRPIGKTVAMEVKGSERRVAITAASLHADVDVNIPESREVKNNVFALVIGNEGYAGRQGLQKEIDVPFARNDATIFKEYLIKTLGIPELNIRLFTDATKAQMETEIDWLCHTAGSYNTYGKDNAEILFYYAGHGLCDDEKTSYLMPVDVIGTQVKQGIRLDKVYRQFGDLKKVRTTAFVDACFSGGARAGTLVAARGITIEPDKNSIRGNVVVFSAASGHETAYPYDEKQHGMFTYYLLKKLQETSGNVSYGELSDYLKNEVVHNAFKINHTQQTPVIQYSNEVETEWGKWRLK